MQKFEAANRATLAEYGHNLGPLHHGIASMLGAGVLALGLAACGGDPSFMSAEAASLSDVEEAAPARGGTAPARESTSSTPVRVADASTSVQEPAPAKTASAGTTTGTTTGTASSLSSQMLASDMSEAHAMLAHGINPYWSWGSGPRLGRGNSVPSDWTQPVFVPWGIAATAASGSPATNARVQIRKVTFDIKLNGVWQRVNYSSTRDTIRGAIYTNYETNANTTADIRTHDPDGLSVKLPQTGGSFHFYTSNRFPIPTTGIQGIVVKYEARLVVDDPNRPDDRHNAKLLVLSGGDFWRSMTTQWSSSSYTNDDYAIGRFHLVTNDWQVVTSHSLRTEAELAEYANVEPNLKPR